MAEQGVHALVRRWWSGDLGAAGALLSVGCAPAEAVYRGAMAARNAAFDAGIRRVHQVDIAVISVGNVAVGGTGKTPVAHFIARRLLERGARPAILHGAYADDEPALHRHWSPEIAVIAEPDRVHGAQLARAHGANVVVLDDGFQHRRLHRDLDIVLIAAERWSAAPRLLPRGPWREPRTALARAGLIMVTRKVAPMSAAQEVQRQLREFTRAPVLMAQLASDGWQHNGEPAAPPDRAVVAVAALAEPELFAANVRTSAVSLRSIIGFADHHAYTPDDAHAILQQAAGGPIVTTEKDWVKLQSLLPHEQVWLLTQRVIIEQGADVLDAQLDELMRVRVRRETSSR